ncbi:MAG: MATE family efflux transporter [Clostridia bacterium]|jgi:putative MATE family efflux protein|nr:MATE family efflux transporter [Clostridia bacterium]MBO7658047.1 MATE family efflux transporter [Clostridia bacterium]MBP5765906.1 MATE family efflux transporter [Clostridia bacterium]
MKDSSFYKRLITLALPMVFQDLMLASVAAADAIMLGNVEQNMMSAVSLATQIQFIQNMILFTVTSAVAVLGSQYWGKADRKSLDEIFCLGLRLSGAVSVAFFVATVFFPRQMMHILTNEPDLIELGIKYLRIAGWSYLLTGVSQCYLKVMKITGRQVMSAAISTTAVLLNIFGNAVFIFGLFGIKALGVEGAALSTLIARIVELVWSVSVSFGRKSIRPSFRNLFRRPKQLTKDFYKVFVPLAVAGILWGVSFASYSAFMGHLGTDTAAANSVAAVVRDLVCSMCNGISGAAGVIVGNELGVGNLDRAKVYGVRLMKISYVVGGLSTVLMLASLPFLLVLVKLTPEAKKLLIGMMIIMGVYMIGRCVNTVIINGIFSAGGDTAFDMYSLTAMTWGLAVPLAFAGTFLFGWHPLIVYACTCVDEVGKIPWVMIHFKKYKWLKDLTREREDE